MYTIYKIPLKDHPPITLSVTLYGQNEQKTKKNRKIKNEGKVRINSYKRFCGVSTKLFVASISLFFSLQIHINRCVCMDGPLRGRIFTGFPNK